ncbi:MAG TPA: hypothetical protein VG146_22045 [Verrucomicrobiae bacterium]|nr:hypothetical protein [Verrucomicrobiae bacterium]
MSQLMECGGKAQRRRRFCLYAGQPQSGVALRLPPHSKKRAVHALVPKPWAASDAPEAFALQFQLRRHYYT